MIKNVLKCSPNDGYMWDVYGGREAHKVKYVNAKTYSCDCAPYSRNQVDICSHIIAVMMELDEFPKAQE